MNLAHWKLFKSHFAIWLVGTDWELLRKRYVTTSPDWDDTIYFDTIRYYLIVFDDVITGVVLSFGQEKWLRNASDQSNTKMTFE